MDCPEHRGSPPRTATTRSARCARPPLRARSRQAIASITAATTRFAARCSGWPSVDGGSVLEALDRAHLLADEQQPLLVDAAVRDRGADTARAAARVRGVEQAAMPAHEGLYAVARAGRA